MSVEQQGMPPAGWYPDPTGRPEQRWWDGRTWTAFERPAEPAALALVPGTRRAARALHRATAEPIAEPRPVIVAHPVTPQSPAQPVSAQSPAHPSSTPEPAGTAPVAPVAPAAPVAAAIPAGQPLVHPLPAQPAPVAAAPVAAPAAPRPMKSSFDPDTAAQPMFPAPVSAVSVQSPTTAAFDFSFSSPDDLGVNGRSEAFRAAAAAATAETAIAVGAAAPAPAERRSKRAAATDAVSTTAPAGWSTSSVWLLVFMPVLRTALVAGAIYALVTLDIGYISAAAIAVVPFLITLLLAFSDRRTLAAKGFARPAHWAWALLGEWLYLLLRAIATRREGAGGFVVVLVWLLAAIAVSGGVYYFLTTNPLPLMQLIVG